MCAMASQITSLTIIHSTVCSGVDRIKYKKNPRHWPLLGEFDGDRWIPCTKGRKMFPFDDIIYHQFMSAFYSYTGSTFPSCLGHKTRLVRWISCGFLCCSCRCWWPNQVRVLVFSNVNGSNANGKFQFLTEYGRRLLDPYIMEMCLLCVINILGFKRKWFNGRCPTYMKYSSLSNSSPIVLDNKILHRTKTFLVPFCSKRNVKIRIYLINCFYRLVYMDRATSM